ncbi:hypothetical protein ZIOFF_005621 [Zingiber officinale]|uniref:Phytocyanin domain-containing protein n=1 Tax=Zingiber officinale TaxID=94328 RepID=A0A8J5HUG2_ZINOF|nr:hypothetical protein ZIOFF_005621 [Zingiber officinale]
MAKTLTYTISLLLATLLCLLTTSQAHIKIHIVGGSYGASGKSNQRLQLAKSNWQQHLIAYWNLLLEFGHFDLDWNLLSLLSCGLAPIVYPTTSINITFISPVAHLPRVLETLEESAIMFLYTSGLQNVVVGSTEDDFATCQQKNVVDILYQGPSITELTEAGTHYYYCSVGLHCEGGQKLKINVNASA